MTPRHSTDASLLSEPLLRPVAAEEREVLNEIAFRRRISIERKRTERSREPFLLMLLDTGNHLTGEKATRALDGIIAALVPATRDTDVVGWYQERSSVGVIFTGVAIAQKSAAVSTILSRVSAALQDQLTFDQLSQIHISFHLYPDDWDEGDPGQPGNPMLYPDLRNSEIGRRSLLILKRVIDVVGCLLILFCCAPICLVLAIAIKVTSKGPILYRQKRVGQYGRQFTFLKFRSMRTGNDSSVHREYVMKLIAGNAQPVATAGQSKGVYKLAHDTRVTKLGRFMRKTSLDELPQLLNVLKGDMSLVGPRPPIPYELAAYEVWHRRRVLEVKPGITGLWQVTGRSRVTFDEMVRLDLRYAEAWSPWLDLKILLRTPAAVVKGAY